MNLNSVRSLLYKGSALLVTGAFTIAITGCGIGSTVADNSTDTVIPAIHGVLHGGPNPVVGARVVMYATTSTGYGVGQSLQEATQKGASAHQDTDSGGNFIFPGGISCPAGQYVYVVAYGGNTGSSGANPNSVLVTALGSCSSLYSGTTYTGSNIWVSEATTVAAAYALANFITVTGNASSGYTVGIGAPATNNNGTTGCVSNAYYTTASCPATQAAGLGHAFTNAISLVSTSTGAVNSTTTNGAAIPTVEINTLADAVQACVNSGGGGTTSGLPSTTTTASGTSHDGTACGKLFAFTSYTNTGLYTGTLTAAGNTLDALLDLVKRPAGTASTFDSNCDSNSGTGTTTAATCIYNLASTFQGFVPALSAAPSDWMIGISYPKAALSNSTSSLFTSGTCGNSTTTTNNGLLYPFWVASDINDDIVILNGDASTVKCANIIAIGPDGTLQGASTVDTTNLAGVLSLALDAWGHAAVPVEGGTTVRFYQYNAQGTANVNDSSVAYLSAVTPVGANPGYDQFDSSSRLYVASMSGSTSNPWGVFSPSATPGSGWHTSVSYGSATGLGSTSSSKFINTAIDINNNAFTETSTKFYITDAGTTTTALPTTSISSASGSYYVLQPDTSGNTLWNVVNNSTTATEVIKYTYNSTPTITTSNTLASPAYTFNGTVNTGAKGSVIDGNNVIWFADFSGSTTTYPSTGGFLRGYDTVNNYGTPVLQGCKILPATTIPITAWTISGSTTTFTTSSTSVMGAGALINLSGFPTSTFFNNTAQMTVTATTAYSAGPPVVSATFTVNNTFGQAPSSSTEAGIATGRASTACGSTIGDLNASNSPFLIYNSRSIAVDTMGNLWVANGTQGQVNEILGIAAPTWPNYIHNGSSNKP